MSAMDKNYFMPSPVQVRDKTVSGLWKKLVMAPEEEGGLGINKKMYGLKHTGADDYILSGVNIEALKSMFGHSSLLMTERYISKLKDVYKDEIRNHAPKF